MTFRGFVLFCGYALQFVCATCVIIFMCLYVHDDYCFLVFMFWAKQQNTQRQNDKPMLICSLSQSSIVHDKFSNQKPEANANKWLVTL